MYKIFSVCLIVCFEVFVPLEDFFTHMETSPWPVKGCKFWPMLGTHGHCPVKVFWADTPTVTPGILVCWSSPRTRGTLTYCRRLAVELSIPFLTTYVCRGWDSNTQHFACEVNALTYYANAASIFCLSWEFWTKIVEINMRSKCMNYNRRHS